MKQLTFFNLPTNVQKCTNIPSTVKNVLEQLMRVRLGAMNHSGIELFFCANNYLANKLTASLEDVKWAMRWLHSNGLLEVVKIEDAADSTHTHSYRIVMDRLENWSDEVEAKHAALEEPVKLRRKDDGTFFYEDIKDLPEPELERLTGMKRTMTERTGYALNDLSTGFDTKKPADYDENPSKYTVIHSIAGLERWKKALAGEKTTNQDVKDIYKERGFNWKEDTLEMVSAAIT